MRNFFVKYFPYAIIVALIVEIYLWWNIDTDKVLIAFTGIIGWASFVEVRGEFDTFYDMVMEKFKK